MLNLTPHTIVLRTETVNIVIPPSGTIARVSTKETEVGTFSGMPVVRRQFGEVEGLPDDGTPCIVSSMVLSALPAGTPGVYAPDTGPTAIRNDDGQVVAVTRLVAA